MCFLCVSSFCRASIGKYQEFVFVLQERSRLASRLRENDQSRSNEKVRAPRNIIFLNKYVWCLFLTFRCFSVFRFRAFSFLNIFRSKWVLSQRSWLFWIIQLDNTYLYYQWLELMIKVSFHILKKLVPKDGSIILRVQVDFY